MVDLDLLLSVKFLCMASVQHDFVLVQKMELLRLGRHSGVKFVKLGLEAFWENWTGKFTLMLGLFCEKNRVCRAYLCGINNLLLNYLKRMNKYQTSG